MLNEGPKTPKPQEFAESVAQSDGYELAAAQTALAQSRNPRVRAFAERMLADHEHMERALGDAAKACRSGATASACRRRPVALPVQSAEPARR